MNAKLSFIQLIYLYFYIRTPKVNKYANINSLNIKPTFRL